MQFKDGTSVFTSQDEEVGHIDRVVIDPGTKEVTGVVVRKGFPFTEDKVVPISLIAAATDERVTLREDAGDLEALPDFEETHYIPYDDERARDATPVYAPPIYWYPPVGTAWLGYPDYFGYSEMPYLAQTERNIPEGTVPLKEGARVISSDGAPIGNVERVLTESGADRATHFVISQGLLIKTHKLIPMHWVRRIEEDEVYLRVDADFIDRLREYSAVS